MKKTIGILGGMGPEATVYMYDLIIKNTRAVKDQDHARVIIYSDPGVPPRTDAIIGDGESPVPYLVEGVKRLKQAGADFIVIPCVTAHYFLSQVIDEVRFEFLGLPSEALRWTKENLPGLKKAGLLASTGTLKSKIFHETFAWGQIEMITPTENDQEKVMEAIFGEKGIKAGYREGETKKTIVHAAHALVLRGAEAVIAGCTEVPLVLKDEDISVTLIEPMQIVAEASIIEAGYELKLDGEN